MKGMDNRTWPDIEKLLTTIAADLDVMLNDLHQNGGTTGGEHVTGCGDSGLLEQYMQYGPEDDDDDEEEDVAEEEEELNEQMARIPLGSEGDEEEEEEEDVEEDMSCSGSRLSMNQCALEDLYENIGPQHSHFVQHVQQQPQAPPASSSSTTSNATGQALQTPQSPSPRTRSDDRRTPRTQRFPSSDSAGYSLERAAGYSVERARRPLSQHGGPHHHPPPPPSHMTIRERLMRTQDVWYLPSLGRDGANFFLQRQQPQGIFVVRHSSKYSEDGSMALSVRAAPSSGQVEHYIIENVDIGRGIHQLQLERSQHQFSDLITLVLHYFHNLNEELPCRLSLPGAILQAPSTLDLQAIAKLGQEFWSNKLAQQKQPEKRNSLHAPIVSPYASTECALLNGESRISCTRERETIDKNSGTSKSGSAFTSISHSQHQFLAAKSSVASKSRESESVLSKSSASISIPHGFSGEEGEGVVKRRRSKSMRNEKSKHLVNSNNGKKTLKVQGESRSLENGVSRDIHVRQHQQVTSNTTLAATTSATTTASSVKSTTTSKFSKSSPIQFRHPEPNPETESGFSMLDNALESFNEVMSSPSRKLPYSGERSAFVKLTGDDSLSPPKITAMKAIPRYYSSSPRDKLSDYEDVWSPKPTSASSNFFKPIGKGSSVSSLDSLLLPAKDSDCISMHNPGYNPDSCSEREDFVDPSFVMIPATSSSLNTEKQSRKKSSATKGSSGPQVSRNNTVHDINYQKKERASSSSRKTTVLKTKTVEKTTSSMTMNASSQNGAGAEVKVQSSHTMEFKQTVSSSSRKSHGIKSQSVPRDIVPCLVEPSPEEQEYENLVKGVPLLPQYNSAPLTQPPSRKDSAPCLTSSRILDAPAVHEVKSDPMLTSSCIIPLSQYIIPPPKASTASLSYTMNSNTTPAQSSSLLTFQAAPTLPLHCNSNTRAQSLPPGVNDDMSPEPPPVPPKNLLNTPSPPTVMLTDKPPKHPQTTNKGDDEDDAFFDLSSFPLGFPTTSDSFEKNFELMQRLECPLQLQRFPLDVSAHQTPQGASQRTSYSESSTVEDLIQDVSPSLAVKPIRVEKLTERNLQRMSDYDNVSGVLGPRSRRTVASSATTYCMPWDSNIVQKLIDNPPKDVPHAHIDGETTDDDDYSSVNDAESGCPSECATSTFGSCSQKKGPGAVGGGAGGEEAGPMDGLADNLSKSEICVSDDEGMEDDQGLNPAAPRLWSLQTYNNHSGVNVRRFVTGLAKNKETDFGNLVQNFIECTRSGTETNPHVVVRNVRQFMNGIKNFLVQKGERELQALIDMERRKLGVNEFLNIDALIERSLNVCIVKPLKQHIYKLFVAEYERTGQLEALSENIKYAQSKSAHELGVKCGLLPPGGGALEAIRHYLDKMQKAYSPLKKLEYLLLATTALTNSQQSGGGAGGGGDASSACSHDTSLSMGADDFLPMFIYVLVQCGMVSAEIEADYMWGLLHPCLLTGNGGYYLTTLSSAVHVLKQLRQTMENGATQTFPSLGDLQGFMNIMIPNETNDSIITKVLPVRPNMTTKDVCTMIAHKINITNPQDYGLYVITMDLEDRLNDTDSPHAIKTNLQDDNRDCAFSYHRINAKFAWPVTFRR